MEIGSEYWKYDGNLNCDNSKFWNIGKDNKFLLSGRTAIYYVLKNILLENTVQKVYFPSYSCKSMTQAFEDLGIEIEYYDVYYNNGLKYNINLDEECDIFFAMNYFGYSSTNMESYIKNFKEKGKIIIEDITHSILSEKRYSEYSDYLIGSLRKWFPIASGAVAVNMNSNFLLEPKKISNENMIRIKQEAMQDKKDYIENTDVVEKDVFLEKYSKSNKILETDYQNYSIDDESLKILRGINLEEIIKIRNENVKVIYDKLEKNIDVRFLINDFNKKDVLLFVPVMIEKTKRDSLRKYLIENEIYLPIHWPVSEKMNNIIDNELSLICDQRYNKNQIAEYIDKMTHWERLL